MYIFNEETKKSCQPSKRNLLKSRKSFKFLFCSSIFFWLTATATIFKKWLNYLFISLKRREIWIMITSGRSSGDSCPFIVGGRSSCSVVTLDTRTGSSRSTWLKDEWGEEMMTMIMLWWAVRTSNVLWQTTRKFVHIHFFPRVLNFFLLLPNSFEKVLSAFFQPEILIMIMKRFIKLNYFFLKSFLSPHFWGNALFYRVNQKLLKLFYLATKIFWSRLNTTES